MCPGGCDAVGILRSLYPVSRGELRGKLRLHLRRTCRRGGPAVRRLRIRYASRGSALAAGEPRRPSDARSVRRGLYLSQITYAVSVALTNAGTATVLQATCTVFVMLITCARARRLPRVADFVGLMCAMAAATLIATQGDWGVIVLPVAGLAWGIANALSETLYIMAPQRLYGRWDRPTIIACGMVISGIVAVLVWLIGEMIVSLLAAPSVALGAAGSILADLFGTAGSFVPDMDATGWLALVGGVGVLGTFAAFGLFLYGVSLVGSVKGSLLGVAEPAGAMVIAALWLHTPFSAWDWIGLVLMAAMIALVSLSGQNSEGKRKRSGAR